MSSAHHWEGRRRQWAIDKKAYLQQDEPIKRNQSNLSDQLKTCKDIPQLETSSRTLNPNFKPIRRYTSTDYNQQW